MSRLARVLSTIQSTPEKAVTDPVTSVEVFCGSVALEQFKEQIQNAFPATPVVLQPFVSLESQQQQKEQLHEDIKAQYQDLMDLLNPTQNTGSVQVYLLDELGMAAGHAGSHASLRAVVSAAMRDSKRVVAALASSWPTQTAQTNVVVSERAMKAHKTLIRNYLGTHNVATFESMGDLVEHLREKCVPAMEVYQEEESSSFVHNGVSYPLNPIFKIAATKPTVQFDLEQVRWLADHVREVNRERRDNADLTAPIIVVEAETGHGRQWVIVDGMHRVKKKFRDALLQQKIDNDHQTQVLTLPAKVITEAELGQPR